MVLYDVASEQLGGAMAAVAEKLKVMEKEGLLREGERLSGGEYIIGPNKFGFGCQTLCIL